MEKLKDLEAEQTEKIMQAYLDRKQLTAKQVYTFMREAISGQQVTPPLFQSMEILGKEKVISRLKNSIRFLQSSI